MKNPELKVIAVFKFARGILALGVAVTLFLMWQNSSLDLLDQFPILLKMKSNDPFVGFIVAGLKSIGKEQILLLSMLACGLCIVRWVEGAGIWLNRSWAEVLAIASGCLYLPFEVCELSRKYSLTLTLILAVNCLVVMYLGWVLIQKRKLVALAK